MPKAPPGPTALREFIDSLPSLDGIEQDVANVLRELFDAGELKSGAIVAALRDSRQQQDQSHDENRQA